MVQTQPMDSIEIRKFCDSDLDAVYCLISNTIEESYSAHYPKEAVEYFLGLYKPEFILDKNHKGTTFIAAVSKEIVGTGNPIGELVRV